MMPPLAGIRVDSFCRQKRTDSYVFWFKTAERKCVMKIYVGNLAYRTTEEDLRQEFEKYGAVENVDIIMDRETNRSKGFGFVEMLDNDQANQAISALDGQTLDERTLKVNEARPKAPRPGGFGGGRQRGGDRRY